MKHNLARERLAASVKPSNLIRDLQLFPTFRAGYPASAYSHAHVYDHNRCGVRGSEAYIELHFSGQKAVHVAPGGNIQTLASSRCPIAKTRMAVDQGFLEGT